jgi:putative ABC transport system substrate-binding protein
MLRGALLLFVLTLTCFSQAWAGDENAIAVIYPDIGEPYRAIFDQIIEGIEDKVSAKVANYPVKADTEIGALKTSLHSQNTQVVIALGRQGIEMALMLNNGIKVVVGGVLTVPEKEARELPVISLTPDPALLFAQIKLLKP